MLYPATELSNTILSYLPAFRKRSYVLYWIIVLMVMITLVALPFIHTTISVSGTGITRPVNERTDVRPVVTGIIDTILYREGNLVEKDAVILRIKDYTTRSKSLLNNFEINRRQQFIHDLQLLTGTSSLKEEILSSLQSPVYREQASRFLNQRSEQEAVLKKANKELELNSILNKEKIISPKEFFDVQIVQERADATFKAFVREQQSNWQQQLSQCQLELSQYLQQQNQIAADAAYYEVKAPASGIIQGINTRYEGGVLQAGEVVCSISPESTLIGECYLSPKDIGLIKTGQAVRFQIDAFDYNYFGILTGTVLSVDNDFILADNKPVFKVRCGFDTTQLHLKNGYTGKLTKGLSFNARFIIGNRSLWQLLWDKIDDWLNPAAPKY